jgi:hypothetical protein
LLVPVLPPVGLLPADFAVVVRAAVPLPDPLGGFAVPVERGDRAAVPSARERAAVPSARDRAAVPSARDRAAVPSARERAAVPSARDRAVVPSARVRAAGLSRGALPSRRESGSWSRPVARGLGTSPAPRAASRIVVPRGEYTRASPIRLRDRNGTTVSSSSPGSSLGRRLRVTGHRRADHPGRAWSARCPSPSRCPSSSRCPAGPYPSARDRA